MIARSHIAFGGNFLVLIGPEERWKFKGGTHTYTRKLEDEGKLLTFNNEDQFFQWSTRLGFKNYALEIGEDADSLVGFQFAEKTNLIVGNESNGLPKEFLDRVDGKITISQMGGVSSLNVAIAASIAFFEMKRDAESGKIIASKFHE